MSFPAVIDNTVRKAFVNCPTKARYRHIENLVPLTEVAIDLHFGHCFATGMEFARKAFWFEAKNAHEAVEIGVTAADNAWGDFVAPPGHVKQRHRLEGAIRYYFRQWPLGEDGLIVEPNGIECMFDIPIGLRHPDTDEVLRYAGRYDMRARDENGRRYAVDEKTAKRLGDSWFSAWDFDSQMSGYIWSIKRGDPTQEVEALVRGIGIYTKDYGHGEAHIIRSDWQLDQWYGQMLRDVQRMIDSYNEGTFDLALHSSSCHEYNRDCDYKMLCLNPTPERLIEGNYRRVVWTPLARK